ncbi:nuclear transport factor 2 family protein [Micromonospora chersina]|uniref:nuclear transport factor 2 family protein n=1 Tax=Micromonospora chersina TaxID=47854 RepID=UPI0037183238
MTRSAREIFKGHGRALLAEDLDGIAANFAEDAVVITPKGAKRGHTGVREAFTELFTDLPGAKWDMQSMIFDGNLLFVEWEAQAGGRRAVCGVDTFVFRDGLIQAQTVRYPLASVAE